MGKGIKTSSGITTKKGERSKVDITRHQADCRVYRKHTSYYSPCQWSLRRVNLVSQSCPAGASRVGGRVTPEAFVTACPPKLAGTPVDGISRRPTLVENTSTKSVRNGFYSEASYCGTSAPTPFPSGGDVRGHKKKRLCPYHQPRRTPLRDRIFVSEVDGSVGRLGVAIAPKDPPHPSPRWHTQLEGISGTPIVRHAPATTPPTKQSWFSAGGPSLYWGYVSPSNPKKGVEPQRHGMFVAVVWGGRGGGGGRAALEGKWG